MQVSKENINFKEILQKVASTPDGEQLLLALDIKYNSRPSFVVGDSHYTAYNEGQRSVVLELFAALTPEEDGQ